jgi:hypothetical protein
MSANEIRQLAKQLDQERAALLDKLEACTEQQLSHKPKSDDWCALGIAEHLMLAEPFMLQNCPELESISPKKQSFKSRFFYPMGKFILNKNISVAPPPGGAPTDNLSLAEIRANWNTSQAWLQNFVQHFDSPELEKPLLTHPLMGPIPTLMMLNFVKVHFDYHHRQIENRIASV